MGQEESTGGTPSDLSDAAKFTSENQDTYELSYTDIYSRQKFANKIMYDTYIKKSKINENDQFLVDYFYVDILKNYNEKILLSSKNNTHINNQTFINDNANQSQLSKYEIKKLDHETEEIYNHILPELNANINNVRDLIRNKQELKKTKEKHNENAKLFCPDCSVFRP